MFLKKITLNNYGLYRGTVSFDLFPKQFSECQPVILFGGQNGAGKTTLFDAIRLVFYGKTAIGSRVSESDYRAFLASKIHRTPNSILSAKSASITIEFEHTILGETSKYIMSRYWEISSAGHVHEKLSILQNGQVVPVVNNEYWSGLIEEIIPERLANLFFFDGEKIKKIADATTGNIALGDAIKTLLGVDLVEKLQSDLAIYRTKQAKLKSSQDYLALITALEENKAQCEMLDENITVELASNKTASDGVQNNIRKVSEALRSEGSVFAEQRDSFVAKHAKITAEINEKTKIIHRCCERVYPFSLCPKLTVKLINQLEKEEAFEQAQALVTELEGVLADIQHVLPKKSALANDVAKKVLARLAEHQKKLDCKVVLNVSPKEHKTMALWIAEANSSIKKTVKSARSSREKLVTQLAVLEQNIQKAPEETILAPMMKELSLYNQRLGALEQERTLLLKQQQNNRNKLLSITRQLEKAEIAQCDNSMYGERIKFISGVTTTLDTYVAKLIQIKINQLCSVVTEKFNSLSSKSDLIQKIQIDEKIFSVTLFDKHGNVLPQKDLSAGEKQIFAVALLWGLSIVSGRSLPVIIDTPLGRLDKAHRRALVHHYFPKASSQVIILSTDTEIDEQWYTELKPYIAKSYMLTHNTTETCTSAIEGYFWS